MFCFACTTWGHPRPSRHVISLGWRMRNVQRVSGFGFVFRILVLIIAALAFSASSEAEAKSSQVSQKTAAHKAVAHKASAAKTTKKKVAAKAGKKVVAHVKKPPTAAQRKAAAVAARKKEAARVARVIRAAGPPPPIKKQYDGVASFYSDRQRLASGGRFNPSAMTAAHRSLPFGTKVLVTDKHSGRKVTVTINDRGPYKRGRVIDLSRAAAHALGIGGRGVSNVRVTVIPKNAPKVAAKASPKSPAAKKLAAKSTATPVAAKLADKAPKKLVEEAKAVPQR